MAQTTTQTIALRIPGHHVIYRASALEAAKKEACRHRSEGRKVTLKWHSETTIACAGTSPAHGTCTNCGSVMTVDCGSECDCGWEIGHCNLKTGEIYGMSSIAVAEAARQKLSDMIEGCDSYADLCTF